MSDLLEKEKVAKKTLMDRMASNLNVMDADQHCIFREIAMDLGPEEDKAAAKEVVAAKASMVVGSQEVAEVREALILVETPAEMARSVWCHSRPRRYPRRTCRPCAEPPSRSAPPHLLQDTAPKVDETA